MQETRDLHNFGKAFKWSVIVHFGIIAFAILKSLVFPGSSEQWVPTLRVDLVGLPDIAKKDLIVPTPPAQTEEAEAPDASDEASKAEIADKEEMVLTAKKPTTEKSKNLKKQEPPKETAAQRKKRLKAALARVKSLDKIASADTDAKGTKVLKGNILSKGNSIDGDAQESSEASYLDQVRDRLQAFWELPVWLARQSLSAQLEIVIDSSGAVRNTRFLKSSGNSAFDEAVLRAVTESQPLPRPPATVHEIRIGFPL